MSDSMLSFLTMIAFTIIAATLLLRGASAEPTSHKTGNRKGPDRFEIKSEYSSFVRWRDKRASYGKPQTDQNGNTSYLVSMKSMSSGSPLMQYRKGRRIDGGAGGDGYRLYYSSVKQDDIVWLVDGFYRMEGVPPIFRKMSDRELPKECDSLRDIFLFPFPLGGGGTFYSGPAYRLILSDECVKDQEGRMEVEMEFEVSFHVYRLNKEEHAKLEAWHDAHHNPNYKKGLYQKNHRKFLVKEGDIIWFGAKGHRVQQIVPPNPEFRMHGWMAIDPKVAIDLKSRPNTTTKDAPGACVKQ